MKATIKMIAERAGVHPSTVDKVLHNRVGVSDEVRQKIQGIIRELDYRPNPAGRILQRQGAKYRIGTVLVRVDALPYLNEGIRSGIARQTGLDIELLEHVAPFQDADGQADILNRLTDERVDAIIVSPITSAKVMRAIGRAQSLGIPVVTTNSDLPESGRLCYVGQDGYHASQVAGRIMGLMLGGKGKIAVVSSAIDDENNSYYVTIREKGFRDFISRVYPNIRIIETVESFESAEITYRETLQVLKAHPDLKGIYVTCGGAAQVSRAVLENGRASDIRVLTYEDYPEILELLRQDVIDVTISGELKRQGELPVQVIMDCLVLGKRPECEQMFTDIRVLFKESLS